MEPTANSPRPPDSRTPPNSPPPAAVPPASLPVEPLSSWDGPGTSYTVTPRPLVPPPAFREPARQTSSEPTDDALRPSASDLLVAEARLLEPAPRRSLNWPLLAGVVVGTLATALLIMLWSYPATDGIAGVPAGNPADLGSIPDTPPSVPLPEHSSKPSVEQPLTITQEPMDDAPQAVSEPVLGERADPVAYDRQSPPSVDPAAQTATTAPSAGKRLPPATPAAAPTPAPAAAHKPAEHKQPAPTSPAITQQKVRAIPTDAVTITGTKPASPSRQRSTPAPATVGTLTVTVQPWAEVWVDGNKRGITPPLITLQLPPGIHTVELRNPDLPRYSQKVQIATGQSVTLRHSFQ